MKAKESEQSRNMHGGVGLEGTLKGTLPFGKIGGRDARDRRIVARQPDNSSGCGVQGPLADHGMKWDIDMESRNEGCGQSWAREHDEINDGEKGRMESMWRSCSAEGDEEVRH